MAAKTYNLGREGRQFATLEVSTYGTTVDHAGTDVIPHKRAPKITYDDGSVEYEERKPTVGAKSFYKVKSPTTSFDTDEFTLRPSDALGTAPVAAKWLKAALGAQANGHASTTTVSAAPAPGVSGCTVASGTNINVGCCIAFSNAAGTGVHGQVAFVASKNTNAITWEPALTQAPATDDVVSIGYGWYMDDSAAVACDYFHETSNTVRAINGCVVNDGELKIVRNAEMTARFAGPGRGEYSHVGTTTVGGAYTSEGTSLTVATGTGHNFHISSGVPLYITVEAEDVNTEEVMKVTARAGDVLTVVGAQKTTSASNHGEGAVVRPWSPTLTVTGTPCCCINGGSFKIDGVAFSVEEASLKIDPGRKLLDTEMGEQYPTTFTFDDKLNPRRFRLSVNAKWLYTTLAKIGGALDDDRFALLMRVGPSTAGKRWVIYAPYGKILTTPIPEVPEGNQAEARVSLEFLLCESSTAGDDELRIGQV